MDINQFRSNPAYTLGMRQLLGDTVMQEALITLKDFNLPREIATDDADPISSVRVLSRMAGYNQCLRDFIRLGEPTKPPTPEEEADYGATNEQ